MSNAYCSMCANLGLADFNSHFLRLSKDPNSRIICPVLLATVCRYCKNKGHTKTHCPVLKLKNSPVKKIASLPDLVDANGWSTVRKNIRPSDTSYTPSDLVSHNPFSAISCDDNDKIPDVCVFDDNLPPLNWGASPSCWSDC